MNRAIVAKYLGQMIPLTSGSHSEDDAVDGLAKVNTTSTGWLGRIGFGQNRLRSFPGRIGDFPDRFQGYGNRFFLTGHNVTPLPWVYLSFGKEITSFQAF